MRIRILAISGSPRRGGNSEQLLDSLIKGAKESGAEPEKLVVCDYTISPCQECGDCHATGKCRIDDEMQGIYPKLLEADHIIVASPVFFKGAPAQLKALIDRCQCLWSKKFVLNKPLRDVEKKVKGYYLGVGGLDSPKTFDGVILTLKAWFIVLGIDYTEQLIYESVDEKDAIAKAPRAIEDAYQLGKKIIEENS